MHHRTCHSRLRHASTPAAAVVLVSLAAGAVGIGATPASAAERPGGVAPATSTQVTGTDSAPTPSADQSAGTGSTTGQSTIPATNPATNPSTTAPSTTSPSTGTAPSTPSATDPSATDPSTQAPSTTAPSTTTPATPSATDAAAPEASDAAPTPLSTTASAATETSTAAAVTAPSVTIVDAPTVGNTLAYVSTGFTGRIDASWTIDGTEVSRSASYTVPAAAVGKTITLALLGSTQEQYAKDSTAVVAEALTLRTTAGQRFTRSFAVTPGSGGVTYSVGYADPSSADPADTTDTPESRLPDGLRLDATTGVLSGTPRIAGYSEFAIVASDGTSTTRQYVELEVTAAAPAGILAYAQNTSSAEFDDSVDDDGFVHLAQPASTWVIHPDGSVTSYTQPADTSQDATRVEGGNPTVTQGRSLWISGFVVDEFGNFTAPSDVDSTVPTVTSDVASDRIAFDEDEYATKVTFPQASTHRLTVARDGVSVSFAVTVVPTAATVGTTPTVAKATTGQLAFTGADETAPIAWALGLIAAGAGLVGVRALRRRRTEG